MDNYAVCFEGENVGYNDIIGSLFTKINDYFQTETVVGDPIVSGNLTLIPLFSISFGAGSGGTSSDEISESFGGAGAGGRITPYAVICLKDEEVNIFSLQSGVQVEKIFEHSEIVKRWNSGTVK